MAAPTLTGQIATAIEDGLVAEGIISASDLARVDREDMFAVAVKVEALVWRELGVVDHQDS